MNLVILQTSKSTPELLLELLEEVDVYFETIPGGNPHPQIFDEVIHDLTVLRIAKKDQPEDS